MRLLLVDKLQCLWQRELNMKSHANSDKDAGCVGAEALPSEGLTEYKLPRTQLRGHIRDSQGAAASSCSANLSYSRKWVKLPLTAIPGS